MSSVTDTAPSLQPKVFAALAGGRLAQAWIRVGKSLFDRVFAAVALLVLMPLFAAISAAILLRRDGPVIYGHVRVGRDGRLFRCLKFRTMVADGDDRFEKILTIDPIARDDWERFRKVHRDPRVYPLGDFLRRTSLDELPQFWNVLRGDMSLVGPRPVTEEELANYGDHVAEYLSVRPGLTGAWQVSGRSEASYDERVALDVSYVRNLNVIDDLRIVLKTVKVVVKRQGAM